MLTFFINFSTLLVQKRINYLQQIFTLILKIQHNNQRNVQGNYLQGLCKVFLKNIKEKSIYFVSQFFKDNINTSNFEYFLKDLGVLPRSFFIKVFRLYQSQKSTKGVSSPSEVVITSHCATIIISISGAKYSFIFLTPSVVFGAVLRRRQAVRVHCLEQSAPVPSRASLRNTFRRRSHPLAVWRAHQT